MIDFSSIKEVIESYDALREKVILISRKIVKQSKLMIYSLHRKDLKAAKKTKNMMEKLVMEMKELSGTDMDVTKEGSFKIAIQEYIEAICYYGFIKDKKIPGMKDLDVSAENYLLGICDLTGELGRKAVFAVIDKEYSLVEDIRNIVDKIYGEFLKLNPRNGELRKKSDSIKWNLKKIDEIVYDLRLKDLI